MIFIFLFNDIHISFNDIHISFSFSSLPTNPISSASPPEKQLINLQWPYWVKHVSQGSIQWGGGGATPPPPPPPPPKILWNDFF